MIINGFSIFKRSSDGLFEIPELSQAFLDLREAIRFVLEIGSCF